MINIHNYGQKLQKKIQSQLRAVFGNVLVPQPHIVTYYMGV